MESVHRSGQRRSGAEEDRARVAGATHSSQVMSTCQVSDATWTVRELYLLSDS